MAVMRNILKSTCGKESDEGDEVRDGDGDKKDLEETGDEC